MAATPPELGPVQLGELTGIVAHQFNNILNDIVLQLAVLERGNMPPEGRAEVAAVRQRSQQAAGLVRELQRYGRSLYEAPAALDLNDTVRQALAGMAGTSADGQSDFSYGLPSSTKRLTVNLKLAPGLAKVMGAAGDIKRLLGLLLRSAVCGTDATDQALAVRTQASDTGPLLVIEDRGPQVSTDKLAHLFEPFVVGRDGDDGLGLSVCKGLARRMLGNVRAENRADGGMALVVSFTTA